MYRHFTRDAKRETNRLVDTGFVTGTIRWTGFLRGQVWIYIYTQDESRSQWDPIYSSTDAAWRKGSPQTYDLNNHARDCGSLEEKHVYTDRQRERLGERERERRRDPTNDNQKGKNLASHTTRLIETHTKRHIYTERERERKRDEERSPLDCL